MQTESDRGVPADVAVEALNTTTEHATDVVKEPFTGEDAAADFDGADAVEDEEKPTGPSQVAVFDMTVDDAGNVLDVQSRGLRDITPAPPSSEPIVERGPGGDTRPYFTGQTFRAALKYAMRACPKEKKDDDSSLLSYVIFSYDHDKKRLSLSASDTTRWHQSFVAADKSFAWLGTFRISREECSILSQLLEAAEKIGEYCTVRPIKRSGALGGWEIAYGEIRPIETENFVSFAHENWEPPRFTAGTASGAQHDAKNVAAACSLAIKSTRVARDEVDGAGRRHITITDEFGHEVARAVLLNIGATEGEPRKPQTEIPGALGPKDRKFIEPPKEPAKKGVVPLKKKAADTVKKAVKKAATKKGKRR